MLDSKNIQIYASRDKIQYQLIEFAKDYLKLENFSWSQTSYLSYLINVLSIISANLMYYTSSVYKEQFLTKAVQKESVISLARMLGYRADLAKPATAEVLISIPLNNVSPNSTIILTGRSDVSTNNANATTNNVYKVYANNIPFSLKNTVRISIGSSITDIKVYEQIILESDDKTQVIAGWKITPSNISRGFLQFYASFIQVIDITQQFVIPFLQPYEFYDLRMTYSETGYLSNVATFLISTDSGGVLEKWSEKESLFLLGPEDTGFTYSEITNGIVVTFGNGIIGKQPANNSYCIINIGLTKGFQGNVISGKIRNSDNIVMNITGPNNTTRNVTVTPTVYNTSPAQNGADSPSIDEIRSNALKYVSMNNRLVSETDYKNASIITNLPVNNITQVIKRSDLKANEITMFTDMIYDNQIVPTQNLSLSNLTVGEAYDTTTLLSGTVISDEFSNNYVTIYDMILDKNKRECTYYYYIDKVDVNTTMISASSDNEIASRLLPIYAHLETNKLDNLLDIDFYVSTVVPLADITGNFTASYYCSMKIISKDNVGDIDLTLNTFESTYNGSPLMIFSTRATLDSSGVSTNNELSISLDNIAQDTISIEFTLHELDTYFTGDTSDTILNTSKLEIIVKKDLSNTLISQVEEVDGTFTIYDIPTVQESWYNNLVDKGLFNKTVLNKFASIDLFSYKMATDYVNLKLANTVGYSVNMQYNKTNKSAILDYDITSIPTSPDDGDRYAITKVYNPFKQYYDTLTPEQQESYSNYNRTPGFIVQYDESSNSWLFESIKTNDMFNKIANDETTMLIYNGTNIYEVSFEIPFKIKIIVFIDPSLSSTETALKTNILNSLVDNLANKFGYNTNFYISEIVKIVQSVPGVRNCNVLQPYHDIFFNYEYTDLTQEQMVVYTPELIFFRTEDISIEFRSDV